MDWDRKLYYILVFQLLMLLIVSGAIIYFGPAEADERRLFEIFGALVAATITVFGIREMRLLTQ